MRPLAELQREIFRAITRAHDLAGETAGSLAVLDEIRGGGRLSAVERLDVYARMYCARLVDALAEDYPRVAVVLGAERFADVAHGYVAAHPSTHPSLRWFGRHFADFLERCDDAALPPFAGELARLEWARLGVFDAPDGDALDADTLRSIAPESWATLRLQLRPAVAVMAVSWPVHLIWDAIGTGTSLTAFTPSPTHLRVWRQNDRVFQSPMDATERAALTHVAAGHTFASLCERIAVVTGPDVAATTAGSLLLRWMDDGILAALPRR
jgi:hypothetical protein